MVMYPSYTPNMYRQQAHPNPSMTWYSPASGYPHQTAQMPSAYCMQEEQQQLWSHHTHPHSVFHSEYTGEIITGLPHPTQIDHSVTNPLPSPTVSSSAMSSPGTTGSVGNTSPHNNTIHNTRPSQVRSPYGWINKNNYQSQPNPENDEALLLDCADAIGKTRTKDKYRVVYTDHQRVELEKEFYYSRYITIRRKAELANNLGLSERQVKIWFQNRRAKERKQVKKREEYAMKESVLSNGMTQLPPTQETSPLIHQNQANLGHGIIQTSSLI